MWAEERSLKTVGGRSKGRKGSGEKVWGDAKECSSFRKWLIVSDEGED